MYSELFVHATTFHYDPNQTLVYWKSLTCYFIAICKTKYLLVSPQEHRKIFFNYRAHVVLRNEWTTLLSSFQDDEWGNIQLKNVSNSDVFGRPWQGFLCPQTLSQPLKEVPNTSVLCREWLCWWWARQRPCPRSQPSGPCLWRTWLRSSSPQRWVSHKITSAGKSDMAITVFCLDLTQFFFFSNRVVFVMWAA